ncbi:dioxygenase [Hydrogenophaga sp.]|uniref:dioxygenase family protein n=1 Tax=Hydrogenophaga sp. TaxID=1904254 RepID=UPI002736519F|nr:class III extradiol ring-cleavage dioxygenase [Hydrogenophaga sp.]MDP3886848.1 class III extradiol ring-cleavage dioxygenase [Hydrogenophaga sp.]MDZ4361048.1 class III extradiol ring-cleavage dioxygenase [Variovorax sp.]
MTRWPTLFISHGAPTFAIDPGIAGPALTALGMALTRPKAVLVVSPHWMTREPRVATSAAPQTVHDFGGFPPALYQLNYPAPGHPAMAARAIKVLRAAGWAAEADAQWGLDHGAWVPLLHLFPAADIPVFQVSLPARLDGARAYAFGQALAPLADEGVLIVGSGSLTHNLHEVRFDAADADADGEDYAREFSAWITQAVLTRDHARLQQTMAIAPHAQRAHPTPEHLWPLMVAAGAAGAAVPATRIEGGITHGVLSMNAYLFGAIPGAAAATPQAVALAA